jgi:hypothetical protein
MLLSTDVYAGPGSGAKPKKLGFFAKIGQSIKKATQKAVTAVKTAASKTAAAIKTAAKKTGMAIKTAGAKIVNAGMDTGVWAKQKLFGKKNKVWVCGHYDKNGKWIKGHWRKLNAGKPAAGGNTADQGSYGDSGSSEQASAGGDSSSAAAEEYPTNGDAGLSGDGNSYEESTDMPVAGNDPVLPELPADNNQSEQSEQSEQTAQSEETSQESEQTEQSGEADQGKEFSFDTAVSTRTMGMLMDDIIKQSQSINNFKRTANSNISYSVDVQDDINTTYEVREDDAGLLARIVVWDIRTNNGKGGKYYNFFINRMNKLDPKNRALVKDVVDEIRSGIIHESNNASSDEEKAVFNSRLSELSRY